MARDATSASAAREGGVSTRRWLVGAVALSVVARVGAAVFLGQTVEPRPGIADELSYHSLALRLLGGHGFSFATGWWPATPAGQPTAHWSFLYTPLLAGIYAIAGPAPLAARLVQAVIVGVAHPWLTWRIATRLFGPRAGVVSAAIVAVYAYFVYYGAALMTEALCVVALLWSVDAALRLAPCAAGPRVPWRLWLELGSALALAMLLRQVALFVAPVVLAWVVWRAAVANRHEPGTAWPRLRAVAGAGVALAVVAACVAPWTIRNHRVFGEFVPLNTNAGFAFFWGNHPVHGTTFIPILPGEGAYGRLIPAELNTLNEAALDKALLARGLAFVREDPVRYARLSLGRAREYLKFWPSRESGRASNAARLLSFGLCLPLFVLGVVVALGWRRAEPDSGVAPGVSLLLAVAAAYTSVHLLTWALVRYRLPVDALLMPFAGLSLVWLADRLAAARSLSPGDER